ncbi:MAG: hypothetical protein WCK37_01670 [Candidatus Falkowbacteria bacterium]
MNKKTNLIGGAILIAVIMFAAGYETANIKNPKSNNLGNPGTNFSNNMTGGPGRGTQGSQSGSRRTGFAGGVSGDILSVDDQGFTINNASSGSAIIFISPATKMEKRVEVAKTDFKIGDIITVMGQKNPDGSYTAQNISLGAGGFGARPNTPSSTPTK